MRTYLVSILTAITMALSGVVAVANESNLSPQELTSIGELLTHTVSFAAPITGMTKIELTDAIEIALFGSKRKKNCKPVYAPKEWANAGATVQYYICT